MSTVQEHVNSAMESAREAAATVGERVSDFFQGNPFSTTCGRKIEMATDATVLVTENWGLNLEICDYINNTAEGGRDAIRAIRKRLHSQISKNNAIVIYTLTVLETCVKNCDIRFHELVCNKDFINDLVKLIGPKFDAPQAIQERVLSLIQTWNDTFHGDPRLNGVCQVYNELKAKGVEFPIADVENVAPIITPKRSHNCSQFADQYHPVYPSAVQLEKLRSELDVVNNNIKVFRELLSELTPGKESPDEFQLLVDLHAVCKQMQERILDLICSVLNEGVTYEIVMMNEELNSVFDKYTRYMANRDTKFGELDQTRNEAIAVDESVNNRLDALAIGEDRIEKPLNTSGRSDSPENDEQVAGTSSATSQAHSSYATVSNEMSKWCDDQEKKGNFENTDQS